MALLRTFLSEITLSKRFPFSDNLTNTRQTRRRRRTRTYSSLSVPNMFSASHTDLGPRRKLNQARRGVIKCSAVTEVGGFVSVDEKEEPAESEDDQTVLLGSTVEEQEIGEKSVVDYDWREEWYPLYLTRDIPDDAPLGLNVFDKQIVLYRDGCGFLHCYEDRCPHRLAKLSEGQLVDGKLECLYHGWQFEGDGKCVKIPQLPAGASIPRSACLKTYEVRDSQGVVWVWMSDKNPANPDKLPWFENFARPGFQDVSTIHVLPYDHSILLENLMDPAHIPISHDRTDWTAKREEAQPLLFKVTERTGRGFAGHWGREMDQGMPNFLRFEAPCVLQNNREFVDKNGEKQYFSGLFLCRPAGQGKSMLIVRFGGTRRSPLIKLFPQWYFHQNASKVFEQDMGFLSSQNEVLIREKVPTKELYLNMRFSDTWVTEYRKWMDKVGHGMPYHFGHSTISLPKEPAVLEHAPAGLVAGISASLPAKGGVGTMHAPNPANRYFRHVIHCKVCRNAVQSFHAWKNALSIMAISSTALAILVSGRQWKTLYLVSTAVFLAGVYACSTVIAMNMTNFIRKHRRA
ncbi:protein TIC 55, chloroplastic-like [Macadamia integrifolia]|uniref:protein TIC 55, chloroplastic-like n=1 Tax=Macadamia integrifolia TaxID=60698 RepID=UPI001C4F254F|nr:protein TIC 55, chloroplastic-like [Macadamia integrifolia]